ncbi:MAG: hypothetical protein IKW81_01870 [Pseudobutyrivibrio sp.]|nr:hypothetical protein [Pseudobutyrivibrio sp.]
MYIDYIEVSLLILVLVVTILLIISNRKDKNQSRDTSAVDTGVFCIKEPRLVKNICCICWGGYSIGVIGSFFSCIWTGFTLGNILTVLGFLSFECLGLYCLLRTKNWRITVNKEQITYRNWLGFTKEYTFKEITVKQKKNSAVLAYKDGKKIFSIGTELIEFADFLWWAYRYNVVEK